MKRLLPYIKPYWHLILLAVVLLFVMVNADLALPDYLSQIVNIGIQQNGVDISLPEALRQTRMDQLAIFQSESEHTRLLEAYDLVEPNTPAAEPYQTSYPLLKSEPIYILKPVTAASLDELTSLIAKPMILTYGLDLLQQNPQQAGNLFGAEFTRLAGSLPAGTDLLTAFSQMPETQRAQVKAMIDKHLLSLEGSMLNQIKVRTVVAEYEALGVDMQKTQTNYILNIGSRMLLMALLAAATSVSVSYLAARTSAGVARDVRLALFSHVEQFSSAEFDSFSTASLITRSTNDVSQVQQVIYMIIRMAFMAPLMGIGGVIRAIDKSPNMWWLIALAIGILLILIMTVFVIALPRFKTIQGLVDRLNLVVRENLSGLMVVRAFNKQGFEENRFDEANQKLTNTTIFIGRIMVSLFPFINLIMTGLSVLIIWVGAHEVAQSTLQVGNLMAFLQYASQILFSFINLSMLFIMLPRAAISGDRIADVLEKPIEIQDPVEPKQFGTPLRGKVEFVDVDFRYPNAEVDVLHDISFTAQPGQVTSIIGSTGSGKSTLVNLIPRFYEVSNGSIQVDGVDIRAVTQNDLRQQIGYVPQKGLLFSGSIASNLRVARPDASEDDMREAIEIAQAGDFVLDGPEGLEAEISQGGINVSGGQKQRLAIARALVKKPPIFIFDDSFSALDFKTDAALRSALHREVKDSTILIVTQRVATAKNSDQILVLDNGRVAGIGKHQDLMKTCPTYQEIANSQLNKQELA